MWAPSLHFALLLSIVNKTKINHPIQFSLKNVLYFYDHRIGNFHWICLFFYGNQLSFSAVPSPENSTFPAFVDASPNHGPISGGTKITIVGRNLDQYGGISFIYIGNMKLPIKNWTRYLHDFSPLSCGPIREPVIESTTEYQHTFRVKNGPVATPL